MRLSIARLGDIPGINNIRDIRDTGKLRDVLGRLVQFGALWLLLVDLDLHSPIIAAASILAAVAASFALWPAQRPRWRVAGLLRFIPHFLRSSLAGGFDVARRVFLPSMPIAPAFTTFPLRLATDTAAATFFVDVVSLLPGTLCADLDGGAITLHVIDRERDNHAQLRELEERIAAMFGAQLGPPHQPDYHAEPAADAGPREDNER